MRRAERLFRLVNDMRTRSISRADDLAAQFEASVRTIYRAISHLQASGLPIEGEAGVGYLLRPGFDLPSLTFTFDQVDAQTVGLSYVESMADPGLAAAAREARARIQASMPQPEARKLADAPYFALRRDRDDPPHLGLLRDAIRKRLVARLVYADGAGQGSTRCIRPLAVWNFAEGWMFTAWCDLRQDFRTFRFDRITSLALTGDRFDAEAAKGLSGFLAQDQCEARP